MRNPIDELLDLSVVIPAYNESLRLPPFLESIRRYLGNSRWAPSEVVVVDDGRLDRTPNIVDELRQSWPQLRLISFPGNRGKGVAVRAGVLASRSRLVLVIDADGSTPVDEIERLALLVEAETGLACGSRHAALADVGRDSLRELVVLAASALVKLFAQCPVFGIPPALQPREGSHFSSCDVEIKLLAELAGAGGVSEVGVKWK